jgi:hypothetical protein
MNEIGSDILVDYGGARTLGAGTAGRSGDSGFAVLLSEMLKEQASSQLSGAVSDSGLSSLSALCGISTGGDTSGSLPTALWSGEGDTDSQLGIMLVYMLMNSESDSGSMLLSSLLTAAAKSGSTSPLSAFISDAGADSPAVTPSPVTADAGSEQVPAAAWVPTNPDITGDEGCRSASLLGSIIRQFDVESSARYAPYKRGNDTYCNIFVWDVTSALGAEIPHYVDPSTGQPRHYPDTAGAMELDANATCDWLSRHGCRYGWTEVGAEEAQAYANSGHPAVTAWKNPSGGAGHVQVVCPSENGAYDSVRGVTVAQSGAHNCEYTYISSVYSSNSLSQVHYYVHA